MDFLQVFNYGETKVRTMVVEGQAFFVGKDVADVLGYSNTAKAIRDHVDAEDRRSERIVHPSGGIQESIVINESGLYSLIIKSKLPIAKKFKRWVTSEVLPSIRKHGMYAVEELTNNPEVFLEVLNNFKKEREQNIALSAVIEEQKPIIDYHHQILQSEGAMTITQIAQDYGLSAQAMNQQLKDMHIQRKVNGQWILCSKYMRKGYTRSETTWVQKGKKQVVATKWTQKGRLFLYEKLKEVNIYPNDCTV